MGLEQRYQQVEAYLKGKLSASEKHAFEQAMQDDPKLQKEVNMQKAALEVLELEYIKGLSNMIRETTKKPLPKTRNYWKLIVFGSTIIATALFLAWPDDVQENTNKLTNSKQTDGKEKENATTNKKTDANSTSHDEIKSTQSGEPKQQNSTNKRPETKNIKHQQADANLPIKQLDSEDTISLPPVSSDHQVVLEEKETEASNQKAEKTPCPKQIPDVQVKVSPAHFDNADGKIEIINQSAASLQYKIPDVNDAFQSNGTFTNLGQGSYTATILSAKKCPYELGEFRVPITSCSAKNNYVFNPVYDNEWRIPVDNNTAGEVTILDKMGKEVYNTSIAPGNIPAWNGIYNNGSKAEAGLHTIIIKLKNNETCLYNVVVAY